MQVFWPQNLNYGPKVEKKKKILRGDLQIFLHLKSYFVCEFKPHAKFQKHMTTPSGKKVTQAERKKEKNTIIRGHYILPATPKDCTPTLLGPIIVLMSNITLLS